jgi:serine/threonine protein kinase/Tol biopolymer transport system component
MPILPGRRLGPHEILSAIGAGGMGEVYKARDTRLDRIVAIKVLPVHLADRPELRERFEREAKTIASLNHPHICVLHDIGQQDGVDFLVMECLEGETLAQRLLKGPLPLVQVLQYAIEISDALDKAHRKGVTHRDLKPSNIMLTKTGTKLLDFGLAKLKQEVAPANVQLSELPTAKDPLTAQGTIVGTLQYMAPEQLEGKEVDARTDIFAFGAVVYEMATGKRAFEGKTQASVISSIMSSDPVPMTSLQPMTPPALDRVVKKCLAKEPENRWQTPKDLCDELKWIVEGGAQAEEGGRVLAVSRRWERASWLLAATFFLLTVAGGAAWWQASNRRPPPMYFHTFVPFSANDLALSPDGRMLAMIAYSAQANNYMLWTYEVGGRRTNSLDGTQGASFPFWSPDGKFIGFFADGKLKKVDVSGGQVQALCDAPNGRGGTWNRDGVIVFTPDGVGGLSRVSSSGGSPVEMTKPDTSHLEWSHRWPVFMPDGKHFIYLGANFSGHLENNAIFLGSLDSQERRLIVSTSANAAYAEPNYLVYLRDKTLVVQPFDLRRYVLSGEPHTLSDEVLYNPTVDRAVFSASSGEVLVMQTGKGASLSQLTWFDRTGKSVGTVGMPGSYGNVRLSTDGRRVVTDQTDPDGRKIDIWIHEPARGTARRLTFDPEADQTSIWSPDGKQILFGSNRKASMQLFLKNADGSGPEELVADPGASASVNVNVWDWSRDGKYILFGKGNELWYLSWPQRVAKALLQSKWTVRNAQFSPDGRWMAYASNETGSMEIYVSPFPSGNGKWQVSGAGGQEPRWRQDGKELFYVSADRKMMAVAVTAGASFEVGSPVTLFQTHLRQRISTQDVFSYDVSGDGQRFLINTKVDEANAAPLSILLNWASEMEK